MEQQEEKTVGKKRVSPEATVLLTIAGTALAIVMYGIINFLIIR